MANVQKYLNHLLQNVGVTPACSEEERAASDLISEVFRNHGFEPEVQEFSASTGAKNAQAVLGILVFVGSVLMGLGGFVGGLGFILALAAAVLFVMERNGRPVISKIGSNGLSQNVIAYHKATGPLASPRNRPVVVVAHYDSPRVDFLAQTPYNSYRTMMVKFLPFAMLAPAILAVLRALPLPAALKVVLWLVAIVCALVPLIQSIAVIANRFVLPYTTGSVCNKSSVAALMGVMDAVSPFQGANEFPRDRPFDEFMAEQEERFSVPPMEPVDHDAMVPGYGDKASQPYEEDGAFEAEEAVDVFEADGAAGEVPAPGEDEYLEESVASDDDEQYGTADDAGAESAGDESGAVAGSDDFADAEIGAAPSGASPAESDESVPADEIAFHGEPVDEGEEPITVEARERSAEPLRAENAADAASDIASDTAASDSEARAVSDEKDGVVSALVNSDGCLRYGADAIHALGMVPASCVIEYTADALTTPAPAENAGAREDSSAGANGSVSRASVKAAAGVVASGAASAGGAVAGVAAAAGAVSSAPASAAHAVESAARAAEPASVIPAKSARAAASAVRSVARRIKPAKPADGERVVSSSVPAPAPASRPVGDELVDGAEAAPAPDASPATSASTKPVQETAEPSPSAPDPDATVVTRPVPAAPADSAASTAAAPPRPATRVVTEAMRRPASAADPDAPLPPVVVPPRPLEEAEQGVEAVGNAMSRVSDIASSAMGNIKSFFKEHKISDIAHFFDGLATPVEDETEAGSADGEEAATDSSRADGADKSVSDGAESDIEATMVSEPLASGGTQVFQPAADEQPTIESTQVAQPVDPTVSVPASPAPPVSDDKGKGKPGQAESSSSAVAPVGGTVAMQPVEEASHTSAASFDAVSTPAESPAIEAASAAPAVPAAPEPVAPSVDADVDTVDSLMAEISNSVSAARESGQQKVSHPASTTVVRQIPPVIPDMSHLQQPAPSNRTALFDLPDPSVIPADPFAPEGATATTQASKRGFSVVDPRSIPSPASVPSPATPAPASPAVAAPHADAIETISVPSEEKAEKRGLGRLFGRKRKKDEDSMSDWLGVDEDFDAKRSGGEIGSWDKFEDDDSWKGGAAGEEGVSDEELRDAITSMGDDELLGHDIWFVATGASELGNAGVKAFLNSHRDKLRGVFLINLESVGSGALAMLGTEGEQRVLKGDRRIMNLVSRVASDFHIDVATVDMPVVDTDAHGAMEMSLRALTIAGVDGPSLACSHTAEDQVYNVDTQNVAKVADIVTEVIRRS